MIDAQGTMRLMFDTMDAYDRADFDASRPLVAQVVASMATRLGG